jgi:short-subunit dehydrogenase
MADTLIWISGATAGLGEALAHSVPYENAKVINVSRRRADRLENLTVDLVDPRGWLLVGAHFEEQLRDFQGSLALFIQCAIHYETFGYAGEIDSGEYLTQLLVDTTSPLYLGHAFIKACSGRAFESGLVMLSSGAAAIPTDGASGYCAAKAGIEMWTRAVGKERQVRESWPWVFAVRPGSMNTPGMKKVAATPAKGFPTAPMLKARLESGGVAQPEDVAQRIWRLIEERTPSGEVIDLEAGGSTEQPTSAAFV